jgi:ankyrin repeat protein
MFLFQTPLHTAARWGNGDVVEILLRNGANINEKAVKNISVGETDDFEKERERASVGER